MKDELKTKALGILSELKKDLGGVSARNVSRRIVLEHQLVLVESARLALEDLFAGLESKGVELQVFFFKSVYPEFKGMQLYCQFYFGLLAEPPLGGVKELKKYYQGELVGVEHFLLRYHFHYGYYCLKAGELDELLFVPGADYQSPLFPVLPFEVPTGVPLTAYLFGMFIAHEQLRMDLLALMADLDSPPVLSATTSVTDQGKLRRTFQWTSEVIYLIELAHGLHLKGVINNGETGITEFFEGLGDFFGVNLGVPKRGFEDLKARKRFSKTHFTDQLRDALLDKISETDTWKGMGERGANRTHLEAGMKKKSGL